jgi:hypothetical protein
LTARVFVNRVWKHLLGEGLVRTPDDFGKQGERPTHPALLDELAVRFMEDGWSVKRLIRLIVLSHVYQLGTASEPALLRADSENRLFGRAFRRRAEAEVIRDAVLQVAGRLNLTPPGSPVAGLGERAIDNDSKGGIPTDSKTCRSVYLPVIRNDLPPIFEVFDFADPEVTTGRRDSTTVATQALYLMNSPFVLENAQHTARRLLTLKTDDTGRLTDLYRCSLGRAPTKAEAQAALHFLAEFKKSLTGKPKVQPDVEAWAAVCLAMFGCTEFRFVE